MYRAPTSCASVSTPRAARPAGRAHRAAIGIVTLATFALVSGACTARSPSLGRRPAPNGPADREMVFPVSRDLAFSDSFGAPRAEGRTHAGQDLMAPKMTSVVAAADGTVTWLKWTNDGLGGNYLILTDADGWSYYYIHLNNDTPGTDNGTGRYDQAFAVGIRKGQKVKAGEVIGFVGDSGDAETTGPHLHFELHDPSGAAINAYNSLAAARLYLRSATDAAADQPFGIVDSVTRESAGTLRVTGWGIDAHADGAIHVSVYVDGNPAADGVASGSRPDLAAVYPGRGTKHGFTITGVGAAAGAHVCVVLHSIGGGGNLRVTCAVAPA